MLIESHDFWGALLSRCTAEYAATHPYQVVEQLFWRSTVERTADAALRFLGNMEQFDSKVALLRRTRVITENLVERYQRAGRTPYSQLDILSDAFWLAAYELAGYNRFKNGVVREAV